MTLSPRQQAILLTCPLGTANNEHPPYDAAEYARWRQLSQETRPNGTRETYLLGRGFLMALKLEEWGRRAISLITVHDSEYPEVFKRIDSPPPVLYATGDAAIAINASAVVNADRISPRDLARRLLETGAPTIALTAKPLAGQALNRAFREPLMKGALLLLSAGDPQLGTRPKNTAHSPENLVVWANTMLPP